ncbi:carbohydrate ABC transporter permease [Microbacterium gilvum]|uniref:Sugar ABC transporter permease n=1 Tax=Microbacterium gilvum TaxID=1336204 RepID=A0ABP9A0A8_9MICO
MSASTLETKAVTTTRRRGYRPPPQLGGRRRGNVIARRRNLSAFLFLLPGSLVLLLFVFYPTLTTLSVSFTDASGLNIPQFIGLENYVKAFTDPDSLNAMWNTIVYAVFYAPLVIIAALALALLLNRKDLPFRSFLRTIIFLPFIISMAVSALAWTFLIDPNTGLIPYWFSLIGIQLPDVLQSTTWAMPTVVLVAVWKNFGYFMVIFIAGLQGISGELYEAAKIDGANAWSRFLHVTLPGLRSTMTYIIILAANGAFQTFDQIYVMTQGGPQRMTETLVYRIYTEGFTGFRQGYAASLSFILMLITMTVGVIQLIINARQEKDLR